MSSTYDAIRVTSGTWVRAAGSIACEMFGRTTTTRKADSSPVTEADHAVQAALLEEIARSYPNDAVIAEETLADPARHAPIDQADRCWIVDPIDGTRNFARCYPSFTVSVALMERGRPVMGLVYDPMRDHLYSASAGGGAWFDDKRVHVADGPLSQHTLIGMPSSRRGALAGVVHDWIDRMIMRNAGSTALHLAFLSSGAMDAVYCDDCKLWDVAAGMLLATEAGAQIMPLTGVDLFPVDLTGNAKQPMPFLAAGPQTLAELWAEYQQASKV